MTWLQHYRVRHYLANSIWILPVLGLVLALAAARALCWIESSAGRESGLTPDAAQTVLATLAASMFTFIVFVSSALLLAVQLASALLTPRVIGLVFKDPVIKGSLTLFVFSFTFALAVLVRVHGSVPVLAARLAAYSCLISLGVFLYLIDHVGKALRPSGALRTVARLGREVIHCVYPQHPVEPRDAAGGPDDALDEEPACTILSPRDGVVLGFDVQGLVALAQRADCIIQMVPQVGDFVAIGEPLFQVYRGGATLPAEALCQSVAMGTERTPEQDPAYAFRIIVDVASKGLSPAINDPTTAVLAIDQIHNLLRTVGNSSLGGGKARDTAGRLRLVYRMPDWQDFVHLAVTEIRQFGGESIQVVRRLRAMLEDLIHVVPKERAVLLVQELDLVHKAAKRFFHDPEDQALADVSDSQGVGGQP